MRKSGKSMLFFDYKNTDFYIEGHILKPIVFDFLYFFIKEKICAIHFGKYIFFLRTFFHFFCPFLPLIQLVIIRVCVEKRAPKHCTLDCPLFPNLIEMWLPTYRLMFFFIFFIKINPFHSSKN